VSPGVLGELVAALDQVFHLFVGQLPVDEVLVLRRERVGIEQAWHDGDDSHVRHGSPSPIEVRRSVFELASRTLVSAEPPRFATSRPGSMHRAGRNPARCETWGGSAKQSVLACQLEHGTPNLIGEGGPCRTSIRLHHAGLLDPTRFSPEHKDFIKREADHEKVEHLIKGATARRVRPANGMACIPTVTVVAAAFPGAPRT